MYRRFLLIVSLLVVFSLVLSACGGAAEPEPAAEAPAGEAPAAEAPAASDEAATLEYWLWDSNQQPAYQQCADAFHWSISTAPDDPFAPGADSSRSPGSGSSEPCA